MQISWVTILCSEFCILLSLTQYTSNLTSVQERQDQKINSESVSMR